MNNNNQAIPWSTLIFSGIGVAVFGFLSNIAWEIYSHRDVGSKYVDISIRIDSEKILLFARNNSDDPLDLKKIKVKIQSDSFMKKTLGAYPDISHIYKISSSVGKSKFNINNMEMIIDLDIIQVIEPKGFDHFGISINDSMESLTLENSKISVEMLDILNNSYFANYQ